VALGHFRAHYDRPSQRLIFERGSDKLPPLETMFEPQIKPTYLNIADPSGVNGSPVSGDVDLANTTTCADTSGGACKKTTCLSCGVELIWGSTTQSLLWPIVQIASATGTDGGATTSIDAVGSDTTWTGNGSTPPMGAGRGYWNYTQNSTSYYILPGGNASRTWLLDDSSGLSGTYDIEVYAGLGLNSYTGTTSNGGNHFTEICTGGGGGTALTFTSGVAQVTGGLPFDFYVYDQSYSAASAVNVSVTGQVTFGSTLPVAGSPVGLPSSKAPNPGIFPYWENLVIGSGQVCYLETAASGNNPATLMIEWNNLQYTGCSGSAFTFEVQLTQGNQNVDMWYNTLNTNGCTIASPTVGIQGPTGTGSTITAVTSTVISASKNTDWNYAPAPLTTAGTY
jgi:hypothetical protein